MAPRASPIAAGGFQQPSFIFERNAFDFGVLFEAFKVLIGQGLDRRRLCFTDPCDGEFHGIRRKTLTAEIAEVAQRTRRIYSRVSSMSSCLFLCLSGS